MKAMHDMDGTIFNYQPILEGRSMSTYGDLEALKEEEHARLLKALQSARDYSYEANMGDYSMGSINRAKEQLDAAKKALTDAGYEVPSW